MSRACKCGEPVAHARAVESAVFQCLRNAWTQPALEAYWRAKADLLEQKFKTSHGRHYSYFVGAA